MSKNKSPKSTKSTKSDETSPTEEAPKRKRKPVDPDAPKRSWSERQYLRANRLVELAEYLTKRLVKASHPAASFAELALDRLTVAKNSIAENAATFKAPAARAKRKAGIGDVVRVRPEFGEDRTVLACGGPSRFESSTVIEDDRTNWVVQCSDGTMAVIAKKKVERVKAPVAE